MDTKALVERLSTLFCDEQKAQKRYTRVWLEEVDFGGLYRNGMFVLNVKAEHHIDSCFNEISYIISMLNEKSPEELKMIWRVFVYNSEDQIHCRSNELLIFEETDPCVRERSL